MKDEVNPAANPALHARAEHAALEAYLEASAVTEERRMKLMDHAAAAVFRAAGTPRDTAAFYAECVTALVLCRVQNGGARPGANVRMVDAG